MVRGHHTSLSSPWSGWTWMTFVASKRRMKRKYSGQNWLRLCRKLMFCRRTQRSIEDGIFTTVCCLLPPSTKPQHFMPQNNNWEIVTNCLFKIIMICTVSKDALTFITAILLLVTLTSWTWTKRFQQMTVLTTVSPVMTAWCFLQCNSRVTEFRSTDSIGTTWHTITVLLHRLLAIQGFY